MDNRLAQSRVITPWCNKSVLILIVVDNRLALLLRTRIAFLRRIVLILIVVDNRLARAERNAKRRKKIVLILIVVDNRLAPNCAECAAAYNKS